MKEYVPSVSKYKEQGKERKRERERKYTFTLATVNGDPPRVAEYFEYMVVRVVGEMTVRGRRIWKYGNVCMSRASRCLIII